MLTVNGWLNGGTAALVVIFSVVFAIAVLIKSIKEKSTVLTFAALMGLFAGLLWLGPAIDFFTILMTGNNLYSMELYGLLSYIWVFPASFCAVYLGAELMVLKRKKILLTAISIFGIIFEFFLFTNTSKVFEFHPGNSGQNLIDTNFVYGSVSFILIGVFLAFVFFLCGLGTLIMAKKSIGVIRKKFLYLSSSFNLFIIVAIFDSLFAPSGVLFIVRLGMIACAFLLYYGVKST
ncbi:MAG: hypothetical protein R6U96_16470 [Promethearchaeia archaeon]